MVVTPRAKGEGKASSPKELCASWTKTQRSVASTIAYSLCSGTMLVVNKLVAYHLPAPAFIASVQIVFCVVVVCLCHNSKRIPVLVEPPRYDRVLPYLNYSLLFAGSLFTNIHSLKHSNVETVIVFRSATPVAVAVADFAFLGRGAAAASSPSAPPRPTPPPASVSAAALPLSGRVD
jgi:hypothetical protein